jgi:DNA polymerase I-like protein with 3'-5' exonuclease and polymerase domains
MIYDIDMQPTVLDLETNILNKYIGNNKASPFFPTNGIVLGKFTTYNDMTLDGCKHQYITREQSPAVSEKVVADVFTNSKLLIGHNIKFDLLHLRQYPKYNKLYLQWLKDGGMVWDTQIVEYLITGQSHTYPSLDRTSEKYGGTLKDDKIKEYWNNGIDTAAIPLNELLEYLDGDVANTALVFEKQIDIVLDEGMWNLVGTQMDALLALVEMEYNGMLLDARGVMNEMHTLEKEREYLELNLVLDMAAKMPEEMKSEVSPASSQQLSAYLFGGDIRCVGEEQCLDGDGNPIIYKSGGRKGKVKTRKREYMAHIEGLGVKAPNKPGKNGYHSTDDDTIKAVIKEAGLSSPLSDVVSFCSSLLAWRKLQKDITTYYDGLLKLVFPDGLIHPNFNQCSTGTGRLSSTSPNAQNITK